MTLNEIIKLSHGSGSLCSRGGPFARIRELIREVSFQNRKSNVARTSREYVSLARARHAFDARRRCGEGKKKG